MNCSAAGNEVGWDKSVNECHSSKKLTTNNEIATRTMIHSSDQPSMRQVVAQLSYIITFLDSNSVHQNTQKHPHKTSRQSMLRLGLLAERSDRHACHSLKNNVQVLRMLKSTQCGNLFGGKVRRNQQLSCTLDLNKSNLCLWRTS